jgi:hypothetical protein
MPSIAEMKPIIDSIEKLRLICVKRRKELDSLRENLSIQHSFDLNKVNNTLNYIALQLLIEKDYNKTFMFGKTRLSDGSLLFNNGSLKRRTYKAHRKSGFDFINRFGDKYYSAATYTFEALPKEFETAVCEIINLLNQFESQFGTRKFNIELAVDCDFIGPLFHLQRASKITYRGNDFSMFVVLDKNNEQIATEYNPFVLANDEFYTKCKELINMIVEKVRAFEAANQEQSAKIQQILIKHGFGDYLVLMNL